MEIIYCETCGKRITESDLKTDRVVRQDDKAYCPNCRPVVVPKEVLKTAPVRPSSAAVRPASRRSTAAIKMVPQTPATEEVHSHQNMERAKARGILLLAAGVALIGVPAAIITFGEKTKKNASKIEKVDALSDHEGKPPADTSKPRPDATVSEKKQRDPFVGPPSLEDEKSAEAELDRLVEKLAPSSIADRTRMLELYVERHGHTLASQHAKVMLAEQTGKAHPPPLDSGTRPAPVSQPDAARPTTTDPVLALLDATIPPAQPDPIDLATLIRTAYARYKQDLIELLRKRDVGGVNGRIASALREPALAERAAAIEEDRRGARWLETLDTAITKGALKLKETPTFDLHLASGEKMVVGQSVEFQVTDVLNGVLQLKSKGMTMPMPLSKLRRDTTEKLGSLGLPWDGLGQLQRAFLGLFPLNATKAVADISELRKAVDKAKLAGADALDAAWLMKLATDVQTSPLETAATETWQQVKAREAAGDWEGVRWILTHLAEHHVQTEWMKSKKDEMAALGEQARKYIEKTEGLRFDFSSEDGFNQFKKLFDQIKPLNAELVRLKNAIYIRQSAGGKDTSAEVSCHSSGPVLGEQWDMQIRVNLNVTADFVKKQNGFKQGIFSLRFLGPKNKPTLGNFAHARLHLDTASEDQGHLACVLRGAGQSGRGVGAPGIFEGIKVPGLMVERSLGSDIKPPSSADGKYVLQIFFRKDRLQARLNEKVVIDTLLPPAAAKLIASSPLSLYGSANGTSHEIMLEEFYFRRVTGNAK